MSNPLTIAIADWPVTLVLDEIPPALRARILERYAAFTVPTRLDVLTVHVRAEEGPEFIPLKDHREWVVRTQVHGDRLDFESHHDKGWMDFTSRRGELVLHPGGDTENYLRVLYARLALRYDSLLLHSCGIIRNGRGYVFFGQSGAGKTTTTRLSSAYTILSDDLVIIKKIGARYHVCGVPFRGDFAEAPRTNATAELVGLYLLFKDTRHFIEPIPTPIAVTHLVQCSPFVLDQPENARAVMRIALDLASQVRVNKLHRCLDSGFWEVIDGSV